MSTYTPGITYYLPQTQPWKPNLALYQEGLMRKQSQYDQAYDKISSMYGSLLNSPMIRDGNIKKRDEFFRSIDQDIKKISTMDLSLQQNVDAAMDLFRPFYEDKNIIKDMSWTRKLQNQARRGESYKNCTDPKKCDGQFWQGGLDYLNILAEEFKNASDEEALSFADPEYVPFQNVISKAYQKAADLKLNVVTVNSEGGYMVTRQNGQQAYLPLTEFFKSEYGNDPSVSKMYDVMAVLKRKNYAKENAYKFGGDEKLAEQDYLKTITAAYEQSHPAKIKKSEDNKNYIQNSMNAIDNHVKVHGTTPDSEMAQKFRALAEELQRAQAVDDKNKEVQGVLKSIPETLSDQKATISKVDRIMSDSLFDQSMMMAAKNYADSTYKEKKDVDQYALESVRLKNQLTVLAKRHEYDKEKIYLNALAKNATKKAKDNNAQLDAKGTQEYNNFIGLESGVGTTDPTVDIYGEQRDKILAYHDLALKSEANYVNKSVEYLLNEATQSNAAGQKAKTQLSKILGKNYDPASNSFLLDGKKVNDISKVVSVSNMDKVYGTAKQIIDGDPLYKDFKRNTLSNIERDVEDNRSFQKATSLLYLQNNSRIRKWAKASESVGNKAMFDSLFDKNNNVRSRNEWSTAYARLNNSSLETAQEKYDEQFDKYKEVYINGGMQKPGYEALVKTGSPLPDADAFAVGATGKYASGGKAKVSGLYNASESAIALYSFVNNVEKAGRVKAAFVDDVTEDDFEDAEDNEKAYTLFSKLTSDMKKGGYKASDDVIPGGEIIYRGVAANNSDLISVTIKPDPVYLRTLLKSKNKENLLSATEYEEALKGVTVFMDKKKATDNEFFRMGNITKYDVMAEAGIPIKISKEGTSDIVITKENGQIKTKGFLYENFIRGNDLITEPLNASNLPASTGNLGTIVNQYNYFTDQLAIKNQQTKEYYDQLKKVYSITEALDPRTKNKSKATVNYEQMITNLNSGN